MAHPLLGCLILFFCAILNTVTGTPVAPEECEIWKNITTLMALKDGLNISCNKIPLCTGFECSGRYSYHGMFQEDIDFGLEILPCFSPLKIHFYLNMPQYPFSKTFQIFNTTQANLPIPGANRTPASNIKTEGNISTKFGLFMINSKQFVSIEMNFTMNIRYSVIEPVSVSIVLIPPVNIPVPACGDPKTIPTRTVPATVTYAPIVKTGVACELRSMGSCQNNQMCVSEVPGVTGYCACLNDYELNSARDCVPMVHPNPSDSPNSINSSVWLIIGSVIAGVVVIGAILTMIIYKYRRYQQRYGQHELLVNDAADTTELDNPDPPMLEA